MAAPSTTQTTIAPSDEEILAVECPACEVGGGVGERCRKLYWTGEVEIAPAAQSHRIRLRMAKSGS